MKAKMGRLIGGMALLLGLFGAAGAGVTTLPGGYQVNYDINVSPATSNGGAIQNAFIFEWDSSGVVHVENYAHTIAGSGTTTLTHTISFAPISALIIGSALGVPGVGDEKDHVYTVTNIAFDYATRGLKWSVAFPGVTPETRVSHSAIIDLLHEAAANDGSALAALEYFVATEGSQAAFDPSGEFAVLEWSVRPVPEPATIALLGLGVAGLGYARRKR